MRALPIQKDTTLLALSIFDLEDAADAIVKALKYDPINVEFALIPFRRIPRQAWHLSLDAADILSAEIALKR